MRSLARYSALLLLLVLCSAHAQRMGCTREYMAVCGQLKQQAMTFPNRCVMQSEGATWLSDGACETSAPAREVTFTVAAHTVDCMGVAPMTCLQVKQGDEANWSAFYDPIEGFSHTPGVQYTLLVRATPIQRPPADGSSTRFSLIRVLSRQPAD